MRYLPDPQALFSLLARTGCSAGVTLVSTGLAACHGRLAEFMQRLSVLGHTAVVGCLWDRCSDASGTPAGSRNRWIDSPLPFLPQILWK